MPAPGRDYYGRLYAHGDVERVFTAEHSGLLAREEREAIEAEFKTRSTERRPWYPNLLSCTPTLELGVDIGDLSSLILCSVPPAQASYVQRVGRAGRRDGNSLALSVANARPHDLYFFADPEQMIAGRIEAPGVFLEASAVLERQLTAYCFDRWVETGVDERAVPARVGAVLRQLEPEDPSRFPHSLLQHVEAHRTELLERFVADFGLDGASAAAAGCRRFMEGDAKAEGSLPFRILSRLHELNKQRKTLAGNIKLLGERIRRRRDQVARDRSLEAELEELEQERAALQRLVASIMDRDTFNFFTDEGLLPNYAFPEAGVVLRSVIYRRRTNQPSGKRQYDTWAYEYQRAASSAIAELAPANHFFAGKRKVEIDQVDMALSDIETWRLCPSCSHAERLGEQEEQATCPRCGETSWADSGQKCQMLRMRQVFATSSDRRSFIGDDADDREPKFYDRQMLVEVDPANISKAYRLDCEDLPFGFELLSRATFREVNFGEKGDQGSLMGVAGVSQPRRGFEICRHCGKVQEPNKPARHAHTCTARAPGADQNFTRCVYLYRELCSEAIRILLPVAAFAESDRKLHSFVAALHLGLKQRFGGSIDHLQTAVQDEPDPGTGHRKRYLVLCDTVPGGTGYLKQLMLSGGEPIEVFDRALGVLTRCSCNQDPARDGCYRCLYAYRHSYDMKETSRNAAVELFSAVVERRAKLVEAPDLRGISVNALFDSVLEAKFVEALGRCGREDRPVVMRREIVSGKPGYFFKIGERSYYIEPQVELGPGDGVAAASRADFVIRPATTRAGALPIAVFTDGLAHHKDRVGKDTAQRLAIVRSRKLLVWSLTWKDVDRELRSQADHFANYLDPADKPSPAVFAQLAHGFGAEGLRDANGESSFAWLVRLLAHPEPESCLRAWRAYAFVHALMLTDIQAFAAAAAAESWRKRLDEAFGGDLGAELTAAEPSLLGLYEREGPKKARLVRAFASVEQAAVQEQTFDAMRIGVYLHDTPEARERADFEAIWTGFLRLGNLFQFLPRFVFVTASGLEADAYGLLPPAPPLLAPPGPEPDPWDDIRDTTDPRLHPLLARLAERRWPLPADPPLELVDESGETIAEAELGWPELRLAVLDGPQLVRASRFEARGWRVFAADDVVDRPELLLEAHQPGDKP
ncbi:MAG: DUF1998 domain-containing protein [Deltaproteobacteria bacterium]|nr:DUF1998 domain-containing protein [Deltaproteobacteria bacterium]